MSPELATTMGAVLIVLASLALPRHRQGLGAGLALLTLAGAAALSAQLAPRPATLTFSGVWALDALTTWGRGLILASTAGAVIASPRWFASDRRHCEWYGVLLFTATGALLMIGAADLAELMVALLLTSAGAYTLASYHRADPNAAEAGAKLYFLGALTNPLFFMGAVLLYGLTGSTRYEHVAALSVEQSDPLVATVAVALISVGLLYELGAAPAHPWVPDVAQGSPAPAAAFLTTAPKIAALFALARFFGALPEDLVGWRPALAVVALVTMTLGNLSALWQDDLRRLLGWSSVSQAGYGLMAIVALGRSSWALPGLIAFAVAYAAANLSAFVLIVGFRGRTALRDYRGLGRAHPFSGVSLGLVFLSFIGIPPFVGFAAKLALFGATISAGYAWLAGAAAINTAISVFYYFRVLGVLFLHPRPQRAPLLDATTPALAGALAASTLVLGLGAQFLWSLTVAPVLP